MDNSYVISKIMIFINDYINTHKISDYIQNIVFDNNLIGYACYDYNARKIVINIEKIYFQIFFTVGKVDSRTYLSVLKKVVFHEIRHAIQRKIVNMNIQPLSMLYGDSFNNSHNVSHFILPTENNAVLYSYFYELYLLYCKNENLEYISERILVIKCLIDKIYRSIIPTKEFYLRLESYKRYLHIFNSINSEFIKLLNGFEFDETLLLMIEKSISNPLILRKELTKEILFI